MFRASPPDDAGGEAGRAQAQCANWVAIQVACDGGGTLQAAHQECGSFEEGGSGIEVVERRSQVSDAPMAEGMWAARAGHDAVLSGAVTYPGRHALGEYRLALAREERHAVMERISESREAGTRWTDGCALRNGETRVRHQDDDPC